MKLRIGLLTVLCLSCLVNFKVQWDRYKQVPVRKSMWVIQQGKGNCVTFTWRDHDVTPQPGDSWKACEPEPPPSLDKLLDPTGEFVFQGDGSYKIHIWQFKVVGVCEADYSWNITIHPGHTWRQCIKRLVTGFTKQQNDWEKERQKIYDEWRALNRQRGFALNSGPKRKI